MGTTISFEKEGKVLTIMHNDVMKLIEQLPEDINGSKKTPTGDWVFKRDDAATMLHKVQKDKCHE